MSTPFVPQQVPASTVQDMAKRLSKHPMMAKVTLSRCQEVMARTFGHASFHALKQPKDHEELARQAVGNLAVRLRFYELMHRCARWKMDNHQALLKVGELARRTGQWPLAALCQALVDRLSKGQVLGDCLEELGGPGLGVEVFLMNRLGQWDQAFRQAADHARREAGREGYGHLTGGAL